MKPFFLRNEKKIIYRGTRSQCISKLASSDGEDLKIVKNPRYKWIEIEDEDI